LPDAAACLERGWEDGVAFYDFPEEALDASAHQQSHREHLRRRAPAHQRCQAHARARERPLLVFKLVTRLSLNWRAINGPNQMLLLLAGGRFVDGKLQRQPNTEVLPHSSTHRLTRRKFHKS
jgi:hypothetical protein